MPAPKRNTKTSKTPPNIGRGTQERSLPPAPPPRAPAQPAVDFQRVIGDAVRAGMADAIGSYLRNRMATPTPPPTRPWPGIYRMPPRPMPPRRWY